MRRLTSRRAVVSAVIGIGLLVGLQVAAVQAAPNEAKGPQPRSAPCYFKLHRNCGGGPPPTFEAEAR